MRHKEGHENVLARMAQLFRDERRVRDLTQQEVADQLKITQGSLSKLENGESAPNVIVWLRFCALFGLPENIAIQDSRFKARASQLEKALKKAESKPRFRGLA